MKAQLRFYLLAEESGWNCTNQALNFGQKLKNSEEYKLLCNNVEEAKKHLSHKAKGVIDSFDRLDFYTVTVEDCFLLETSFDYLLLHSFPQFYLNPLAVDPNYEGEVNSIGDLFFDIDSKNMTLNDIILDEERSLEYKIKQIEPRLDYYVSDMKKITTASIKALKKNEMLKNKIGDNIRSAIEIIFFFIVNSFLVFTWINPFELFFNHFYNPVSYHALTYLAFLFPILVLLFDVIFIMFHTYKANITEAYNYAKRFLKKNESDVYDGIDKMKNILMNYIEGAIYAKIKLQNDIRDFSCLSQSYVNIRALLDYQVLKDKRSYKILHGLWASMTTIMVIAFVVFLIIYIIAIVLQVNI